MSRLRDWREHLKEYSGTEADRRRQRRFAMLTLLWAMSFLAATWIFRSDLELAPAVGWLVAIVPIVLAGVALRSYLHFLRNADELIRRIQLEALGIAVAAALVWAIGYPLLEMAGAPELDRAWIWSTHIVILSIAFAVGQIAGVLRYK